MAQSRNAEDENRHRDDQEHCHPFTTLERREQPNNHRQRQPGNQSRRRDAERHAPRSHVTSAGAGPSIGKHILLSYLPPEHANDGEQLLVEYLGEQYPVTVEIAGSTSIFDPENTRIRS